MSFSQDPSKPFFTSRCIYIVSVSIYLAAGPSQVGGAGGRGWRALAPPLVNPISIRGTGYAHRSNPNPPSKFSDLATALCWQYLRGICAKYQWWKRPFVEFCRTLWPRLIQKSLFRKQEIMTRKKTSGTFWLSRSMENEKNLFLHNRKALQGVS